MFLKPTYYFDCVTDISLEFLNKHKIKAILLDLDNTLTTHNNPVPPKSTLEWLDKMKSAGIKMMIVSNNSAKRVEPFAKELGLPFVSRGMKPLTKGFSEAIKKLEVKKSEVCAVGDQIFTDILGANLKGIRSIFVFPIEPESGFLFKVKRVLEKPFLPKR